MAVIWCCLQLSSPNPNPQPKSEWTEILIGNGASNLYQILNTIPVYLGLDLTAISAASWPGFSVTNQKSLTMSTLETQILPGHYRVLATSNTGPATSRLKIKSPYIQSFCIFSARKNCLSVWKWIFLILSCHSSLWDTLYALEKV